MIVLTGWRMYVGIACVIFMLCVLAFTVANAVRGIRKHWQIEEQLKRQAQENIRRQQLAKMVMLNSNAFVWEMCDGVFSLSPSFQDYLGLDSTTTDFAGVLANANEYYAKKIRDFFFIMEPGEYSLQAYGPMYNKEPHWYEFHMHVCNEDGRIVKHGVTVIIDKQKQLEKECVEAHRMLLNAKERENFISSMCHEIRTPLNAIIGLSRVLAECGDTLPDTKFDSVADTVELNNNFLIKIIDDILLATQMQNSNIRIKMEPYRVESLAFNLSRDYIKTVTTVCKARFVYRPGTANAVVNVDRDLFFRAWDNLIDNAVKFSPQGSPITLGWAQHGGDVDIFVSDKGRGIDPNYHDFIFRKFMKVDPFSQGIGIGLSLARGLVERMGGTVGVSSRPGNGSTFWIRFKLINL